LKRGEFYSQKSYTQFTLSPTLDFSFKPTLLIQCNQSEQNCITWQVFFILMLNKYAEKVTMLIQECIFLF